MLRRILGFALETVAALLFTLSVAALLGTLGYPQWGEWRNSRPEAIVEAELQRLAAGSSREPAVSEGGVPSDSRGASPASAHPTATDTLLVRNAAAFTPAPLTSSIPATQEPAAQIASRHPDFSSLPLPSYGRPVRVQIPRIGVDSAVVDVGIENGVYQVPSGQVGHHMDSSYPGEPGNSIFNGHVESMNAGRVFARLHELTPGDVIYVYTDNYQLDWVVQDVQTVPGDDSSFIRPTEDTRITLYTCTGRYNPLTGRYSHQLVVIGKMVAMRVHDASAPATVSPASRPTASSELPSSASLALGPNTTTRLRTLFEERFIHRERLWPNDPYSTAWVADGVYRLFAQEPGRFVAVGAPLAQSVSDVVVRATFRKVGGPPGGGYGLIVRDQGPGPRDGINQGGRYYVFEAGDRGEFGIWRREETDWVELIPWTFAGAIRVGEAANELTVQALGPQLTFLINGEPVASLVDAALTDGAVGIFVGGDFNEAVLDRFMVAVPN